MPPSFPIAALLGFLVGILINLVADYLTANRYYREASANPFVSVSALPVRPSLLPRRQDGKLWSLPLYSASMAALVHQPVYLTHRFRHLLIEIGMTISFAVIALHYADNVLTWPLFFYPPWFVLIVVIDVEWRWVFLETIIPPAIVALIEAFLLPMHRVDGIDSLRGGVYAFGILLALYLLGIVFSRLLQLITKRRVGRTVLGIGDAYIAALGGFVIGWRSTGFALLIMVATGAIAALILIGSQRIRRGRYRMFSAVPYGPYVALGFLTLLFAPEVVADVFLRLMGWY